MKNVFRTKRKRVRNETIGTCSSLDGAFYERVFLSFARSKRIFILFVRSERVLQSLASTWELR